MGGVGLNTVKSGKFEDIKEEPAAEGTAVNTAAKTPINIVKKPLKLAAGVKRTSVLNATGSVDSKQGSTTNLVRNPT